MTLFNKIISLAIPFLLCLGGNAAAQHFKSIGVRDGLTDTFIESIAKDSEGYIWFATHDGLDRFDGYDIKKYSLQDFGLNFDQFKYVAEDKGKNLWVVSATGQVYVLDRKTNNLTDRLNPVLSPLGIPSSESVTVFVDNIGNLWVETGQTLYNYDYRHQRLTSYQIGSTCHKVASDGDNSYISLDDGRIIRITPDDSIKVIKKPLESAENIMIDSKGRLWAYGHNQQKVKYYDPIDNIWFCLPQNEITDKDVISCAIDDKNGRLWFGSLSNGIVAFDYDLTEYQIIEHVSGNSLTIPNNHISSLYLSEDNMLWIGTSRGAALTSMGNIAVQQIRTGINEDVKTIIEDKEGNMWFGMDGKGLLKYIPEDGTIIRFTSENSDIPSQNITSSTSLSDGSILYSSYGGGGFRWDEKKVTRPECSDDRFYNATKYCREIIEDNSGNLWYLTFGHGVACLHPDGKWKHFTMANSDLISNHMTSMTYSEKYDKMFVSNRECIYEISTNSMTLKKAYDFNQVTVLYLDERNILWIGTTKGLWYNDLKNTESFHMIDMSDGLSHPNIMGIDEDHKGDLWVTTNDGFTYIYIINDPLKESIETRCFPYYAEDGLGEGIFSHNSLYCSKDGSIFMGHDGKVIKARPDINLQTKKSGRLTFTSISISGKEQNLSAFNKDAYSNHIKIGYNDNLAVKVSAMDYIDRNKIKFEYNIEEDGEKWVLMHDNQLFLNRIHSGNHTLTIRIAGSPHYPEYTTHLSINVKPPFWKSSIAKILYILIAILCTLISIKLLQSRNRKMLDQERHEMDEAKLQFFTNVSHDLRTPLTMIITPLSKLMRDYKGTPIEEDLDLINRSAQTLMDEVNQLLDFKKIDKEKIAFNPTYGDLVRYIKEILNSFNLVFTDDTIKLTTEICEGPIMMDFDKDKVMRILHNLMSNAFKFNHAKGYVKITLQQSGNNVELIVTDSGTGIEDKHKPHIFERFYQGHSNDAISGNGIGLHIVHEYVKLHDGEITVTDNHPSGSIFTVTLPISHTTVPYEDSESYEDIEDISGEEVNEVTTEEKPKILIVEDNIPFRQFLKGSLADKYKVYEAGNGRAALESLEKHSISIIISDVMMPVMDGLELCREVKNDIRYSHIPIILLTAIQNKDMAVKGLRDGADEYISKPFDVEVLTLKIDKILKWRQENYEKFSDNEIKVSELTVSRLDEELMRKTLTAIENNMSNSEYSVEDLSMDVGISRSGLYKKLMFITGKSPIEFIRTIKLKKGREMLDAGETSVSQIAWGVGFSPKQFSKYFKDEYGCLPSEYMKYIRH